MKIKVSLNTQSIDAAIKQLGEYNKQLDRKVDTLARRLAEMGAINVSIGFSRAIYDGNNDFDVSVEGENGKYNIIVAGKSVLFVEFGAGVTYGYGHPEADKHGMGPGTYPDGKGHWNNPSGWWIPKSKGGGHTYGNPPNMPVYNTAKDLRNEVERVAMEVFQS